eukprot:TRINITY_DN67886_c1_g1_i3.p1 TRINITY_DN67886_c1_g1~~TRINITY_DN67886_c1_g1_i3.p1  ORF type:complete len:534 (+),score=54.93 TRINITY_DN67886_c1_g1_i3:163-1764(+)
MSGKGDNHQEKNNAPTGGGGNTNTNAEEHKSEKEIAPKDNTTNQMVPSTTNEKENKRIDGQWLGKALETTDKEEIGKYMQLLEGTGCKFPSDLLVLTGADWKEIGFKVVHMRKLQLAVNWQPSNKREEYPQRGKMIWCITWNHQFSQVGCFRQLLKTNLASAHVAPSGDCDRTGNQIKIEFYSEVLDDANKIVTAIEETIKQLPADDAAACPLPTCDEVPRPEDPKKLKMWRYKWKEGSPGIRRIRLSGGFDPKAWGAPVRKRRKPASASSDVTQWAHFVPKKEWLEATRIICERLGFTDKALTKKIEELQEWTIELDPATHARLGRGEFFWAWKIVKATPGWNVHLVPRLMCEEENENELSNAIARTVEYWQKIHVDTEQKVKMHRQVLCVRKHVAIYARQNGLGSSTALLYDWNSNVSCCWDDPSTIEKTKADCVQAVQQTIGKTKNFEGWRVYIQGGDQDGTIKAHEVVITAKFQLHDTNTKKVETCPNFFVAIRQAVDNIPGLVGEPFVEATKYTAGVAGAPLILQCPP